MAHAGQDVASLVNLITTSAINLATAYARASRPLPSLHANGDPFNVKSSLDVEKDVTILAAACDQLVSDTGGAVDVEAVRRYHSGVVGVSGFTVAERAVIGDVAGAIEALEWALHTGVPHVVLADALADAVHSIAVVGTRRGASPADLARLGMPPWKARKVGQQARHWDAGSLGAALQVVARLNGEVKGLAEDASYALERAVRRVGGLARA